MSETQFSSLSPNSSNDLELGNHYLEENDLFDQETLSIASDKSVANLEDFNDTQNYKMDPFLSDFLKEENDDLINFQPWIENYPETNEMNVFYNSLNTENDLDEYLSVGTDCLDGVSSDLIDWDATSTTNQTTAQKSILMKRALSPINNSESLEEPAPSKQRRVEVSSHVRCDQWINRYHEASEKVSFKDSGMLDRRKTKHHKVLSEHDPELQVENIDSKRNRVSPHGSKNVSAYACTPPKVSFRKSDHPLSITSFSKKFSAISTFSSNANVVRRPLVHCNYNRSAFNRPYTTYRSQQDSHPFPDSPDREEDLLPNTSNSVTTAEVVEMSRMPAPLKMGKKVSRRGHRLSLWQYLMCLLDCDKYRNYSTGIKWINRNNGVFHIVDSKQVATLWGQYKERREKMTYDSLARSLRHYYKKNLMAKINNRRLVYQIAQECLQWSSESFLKKCRD